MTISRASRDSCDATHMTHVTSHTYLYSACDVTHLPVLARGEPHLEPDAALDGRLGRSSLQCEPLVQACGWNVLREGEAWSS